MVTGFLCVGLALALAPLVAICRKLEGMPPRLWGIARLDLDCLAALIERRSAA